MRVAEVFDSEKLKREKQEKTWTGDFKKELEVYNEKRVEKRHQILKDFTMERNQ
jgi:hypothetical protein